MNEIGQNSRKANDPPLRKDGWNHSERVLVYYPSIPEAEISDGWGIAYYHHEPPFGGRNWIDFDNADRTPSHWWPLPITPRD